MEFVPTPSQTVGPYLHIGLTRKHSLFHMAGPETKGEHIWLKMRVLDRDGQPLNDCMVEIWQANSEGKYDHPDDRQNKAADPHFHGFGRAATDEEGRCEFETIKPGRVPGPGAMLQAPHLNLAVFARGILLQLYTRMYFAGEASNDQDTVLALVPPDGRETLLAQPDPERPGGWLFEIHLCGANETVFFDV